MANLLTVWRHNHLRLVVVKQFNGFTIDEAPDIHINGKLVLGESIGDLAGFKIAYLAFKKTEQGKSSATMEGFTPDKQFFIAWGQFRGDQTRRETQKLMVQGDPHSVSKYWVLGPLSNLPQSNRRSPAKWSGHDTINHATMRHLVNV